MISSLAANTHRRRHPPQRGHVALRDPLLLRGAEDEGALFLDLSPVTDGFGSSFPAHT